MSNADVLYNRNIQIVFGVDPAANTKWVGNGQLPKSSTSFTGFQYNDLRVSFKIEKNMFSSPNKGKINVYNLNSKSRGLAEQHGLAFILRAGYGINPASLPEIFKGNIFRASSELSGSDIITTFEVGDTITAYQNARVDLSLSPGTAIKQAFQNVASSFGKSISDLGLVSNGTFLSGLSLSGPSKDHMDYLCKKENLEWSFQDDTIQIVKKGQSTGETAVLLTGTTGLLNIPKKKNQGIEFKCMMNPKVRPGRAVQIQSKNINGNFRCNRVILTGDNFSTDFNCDVEATPI